MLPPEMPITIFDRIFCANLELLRKYRISDELTLFHASYDYVVIYGRWLSIHYWSFHRDEAYLLATAILRIIYEDEPNRFKEHEFDWLAGFDLISYEQESGALDGIAWFGQRTDRRYRIGEQKALLVGEFSRGGRFRITEPNGFKAGDWTSGREWQLFRGPNYTAIDDFGVVASLLPSVVEGPKSSALQSVIANACRDRRTRNRIPLARRASAQTIPRATNSDN